MERQPWTTLNLAITHACRALGRLPKARYSDRLILRLYFWAAWHDRPMTWCQDRSHYNTLFRPRQVPSVSQLNRRIASERFRALPQFVHDRLGGPRDTPAAELCVDGKPIPVGPCSGDRDATRGLLGKGYKLHAVVTTDGRISMSCVCGLARHEMPVARAMLAGLPLTGTLVLADGLRRAQSSRNYDAHALHKQVHAQGGRLFTRPRRGGARRRERGRRGHPSRRRRMGPARRALIDAWEQNPEAMSRLYRRRERIERVSGRLGCTPGLLGPLPGFVRGMVRVRRWAGAKICLYHARLLAEKTAS